MLTIRSWGALKRVSCQALFTGRGGGGDGGGGGGSGGDGDDGDVCL